MIGKPLLCELLPFHHAGHGGGELFSHGPMLGAGTGGGEAEDQDEAYQHDVGDIPELKPSLRNSASPRSIP